MNKTSVIDFSNPSTFPLKLQQIVSDYYNKKPEIIKAVLETPNYFFNNGFFNSYELTLQDSLSKIQNEICDKTFVLYHATMVDNIGIISQSGIKCFKKTEYIKYIESFFKSKGIPFFKRKKAIQHLKKVYIEKYGNDLKQNVCFFSNYVEGDTFYIEYCRNIGGELSLSAFKQSYSCVFEILKSGEPIIVKFESDYSSFIQNTRECICKILFQWASEKYLKLDAQTIYFDGQIEKSITPDHIIDVIKIKHNDINNWKE